MRLSRDGTEVRRIGAVPLLGRWSVTPDPPLAPGRYDVEAEQGDASGNIARVTGT